MRIALLVLCLLCILCLPSLSGSAAPAGKRVLGIIVAFEFTRSDPLMLMLNEYRSMCEGGWDPTVLFLTAVKLSASTKRFFEQKVYCYRTASAVPVRYAVYPRTIGYMLAEQARKEVKKRLDDFDVFIYQEEDMIVTYAHLVAYEAETRQLVQLLGEGALQNYSIGFQRYCRTLKHPSEPRQRVFSEKELLFKEYLDEFPFFRPVCLADRPYLQATDCKTSWLANPHQAVWILTRQQLGQLEQRCGFLNMSALNSRPEYVREYTSSLSLFANHLVADNCGLHKLLPAERLPSFLVQHYYCWERPKDYKMVFSVDAHVKAGLVQLSTVRARAGYYDGLRCWEPVLRAHATDVPERVLVRGAEDKQVYLMDKGARRRVSKEVFERSGFDWKDVVVVEHKAVFEALPLGQDLS